MDSTKQIKIEEYSYLITGGYGFIGSNMVAFLNKRGIVPYVLEASFDDLGESWKNMVGLKYIHVQAIRGLPWGAQYALIALGAHSNTNLTETQSNFENNAYSVKDLLSYYPGIFRRIVYASSAAVYGRRVDNFTEDSMPTPVNFYGFTKWRLEQEARSDMVGLRFFNVYGPRETFKGPMASVVHKALSGQELLSPRLFSDGKWTLFDTAALNGGQSAKRDFVYVEDVCDVIFHMIHSSNNGIFNVGSGAARTFEDIVTIIDDKKGISYTPMSTHMQQGYQFHTCADLTKLRAAGYVKPFTSLEEGIEKTRKFMVDRGEI